MYSLIKPLLFLLSAERAHRLVMWSLRLLGGLALARWVMCRVAAHRDPVLRVDAMGLSFDNPVGLAAGLDKDAEAFPALSALGFGLVEVGTITAQPQPGNPKPRLFRLPEDRALVNRMGFNNEGAERAAARLGRGRSLVGNAKLGANIGRTKVVANEHALEDYEASARVLGPLADYLVINVSSPNTPGLRDLQTKEQLVPLLRRVRSVLDEVSAERHVPLLVKVAPDLSDEDIDSIAEVALEVGIDGVIATNTTTSRSGLHSPRALIESMGAGGLSGPPVRARALHVLRRLRQRLGDRVVLIASGGIGSGEDAWQRIRAGATLVQVYTALVYEGPSLAGRISRDLARRVRDAGLEHVSDAVGLDARVEP